MNRISQFRLLSNQKTVFHSRVMLKQECQKLDHFTPKRGLISRYVKMSYFEVLYYNWANNFFSLYSRWKGTQIKRHADNTKLLHFKVSNTSYVLVLMIMVKTHVWSTRIRAMFQHLKMPWMVREKLSSYNLYAHVINFWNDFSYIWSNRT